MKKRLLDEVLDKGISYKRITVELLFLVRMAFLCTFFFSVLLQVMKAEID